MVRRVPQHTWHCYFSRDNFIGSNVSRAFARVAFVGGSSAHDRYDWVPFIAAAFTSPALYLFVPVLCFMLCWEPP
jgi:hypothetical protein